MATANQRIIGVLLGATVVTAAVIVGDKLTDATADADKLGIEVDWPLTGVPDGVECKSVQAIAFADGIKAAEIDEKQVPDAGGSRGFTYLCGYACDAPGKLGEEVLPKFQMVSGTPLRYVDGMKRVRLRHCDSPVNDDTTSSCACGSGCEHREEGVDPQDTWHPGRKQRVWDPTRTPYRWRDDGSGKCKRVACVEVSGFSQDLECDL
jgi:hypothetical protein